MSEDRSLASRCAFSSGGFEGGRPPSYVMDWSEG